MMVVLKILTFELGRTMKTIDSVCTYCGVGCDIAAHVEDNKIVKIFAHPDGVVSRVSMAMTLWMPTTVFVCHASVRAF